MGHGILSVERPSRAGQWPAVEEWLYWTELIHLHIMTPVKYFGMMWKKTPVHNNTLEFQVSFIKV